MTAAERPERSTNPYDWPWRAEYRFGDRTEPVLVVGLEPDGEVRAIFLSDGSIRRVAEHRVTLDVQVA
jgi:hypothetical protein